MIITSSHAKPHMNINLYLNLFTITFVSQLTGLVNSGGVMRQTSWDGMIIQDIYYGKVAGSRLVFLLATDNKEILS